MQIFLPPKETQGKVRQSQERAVANNFAFSRVRDPLDHLSVNPSYVTGLICPTFKFSSSYLDLAWTELKLVQASLVIL